MNYKFVLIHGWGGSKKSLEGLAQSIATELRVAGSTMSESTSANFSASYQLIELPGFGNTPLPSVYTFRDYCNFVKELLRENNIWENSAARAVAGVDAKGSGASENSAKTEQLVFVGHSFGGKILTQLAIDQALPPESLLVLINSSGIKPRNSLKKRIFKLVTMPYRPVKKLLKVVGLGGLEKLLQKAFYKFVVGARDYQKLNNEIIKETFKNVIEEHIDEKKLERVRQKTLLLWGELDRATPPWMGRILAAGIPDSRLVLFPGATHGLPLKAPQKCAEEIVKFVK